MKRFLAMAMMLMMVFTTGCIKVTVVGKTMVPASTSVVVSETLTLIPEQSESEEVVEATEEPALPVQVALPASVSAEKPAVEETEKPADETQEPAAEEKKEKPVEEEELEVEPERQFSSDIIRFEEDVSDELLFAIQANYEKTPVSVRSHFVDSGWHIEVVSGLGPRFGYASILGMTRFSENVIYIDNRSKAAETIIHELGHYWDVYGNADCQHVSNGEEFTAIWEAEVNSFCNFWSTNSANTASAVEYFAESYEAFVIDPQGLEAACPETFAFLADYFPA